MANIKIHVELKGLDKLRRRLAAKLKRLEKRSMAEALRAAARPIVDATEANIRSRFKSHGQSTASQTYGPLAGSVTAQVKIKGKGARVEVGPGRDQYWATFVELGHWFRKERGGKKLRFVPAHPFLRPAFDAKKTAALERFREYFKTEVEAGDDGA